MADGNRTAEQKHAAKQIVKLFDSMGTALFDDDVKLTDIAKCITLMEETLETPLLTWAEKWNAFWDADLEWVIRQNDLEFDFDADGDVSDEKNTREYVRALVAFRDGELQTAIDMPPEEDEEDDDEDTE